MSDLEENKPPQAPSSPLSFTSKIIAYFAAPVTVAYTDILMLLCCYISGLVDSTIYNAYGTFVSMQTGNTIFVGLGGSQTRSNKPYGWAKSLTSIFCFFLGCLFWSRFSRFLGPQQRRTLVLSYFLQSVIMILVASLSQGGVVNGTLTTVSNDIDWIQEIPVALLSFQAAGQLAGSRALNLSEIPTVVVTSLIYDFGSDPAILQSWGKNVKRNRRGFAFLAVLAGAICGGWIGHGTHRMESALWLASAIKSLITISLAVWPPQEQQVPKLT
ncbi:MAG: hypothetical protein LQ352_006104 [Teloschistes flavicans]|nr:MAG: hypothetical protein LQ352_006104 [Teloschistes flavicans]